MKYILSVILLPLLLAGCATTKEYGQKVGIWIDQSVDDLRAELGVPSSAQPQADGGSIVTYEHKEVFMVPAPVQHQAAAEILPAVPATTASPDQPDAGVAITAGTRTVSCTTRYKTDSTGVIHSWTFDGEGCKAHEVSKSKVP